MRITTQQKETTRQRILDVAARLFRTQGYDATTTRDIALGAEIAAGTLFNYFPTKEAIVAALAEAALARAREGQARVTADSLEEQLFACIAAELRQLKPHRKYTPALLETLLSPLAAKGQPDTNDVLRTEHLEMVAARTRQSGLGELSPVALQLYWTLYTGLLAFWATDKSPKQEDTLALLDQSLTMFVSWLRSESGV
jgi:AcrR family transcriptional regulator